MNNKNNDYELFLQMDKNNEVKRKNLIKRKFLNKDFKKWNNHNFRLDNYYIDNNEDNYNLLILLGFNDRIYHQYNNNDKNFPFIKIVGKEIIQSDEYTWMEVPPHLMTRGKIVDFKIIPFNN